MSYYYSYSFISPEIIYSVVKEELKSYYDTGAIDDLLFPTYVDKCLRKLGRSSYAISEAILHIDDFQDRLPDNFHAVREAWLCTEINSNVHQSANSFYSQSADATTIQVAPYITNGSPCTNPVCTNSQCDGSCMPDIIQTVFKTNQQSARTYKKEYLLKPGNISANKSCDVSYTDSWNSYNPVPTLDNFTPNSSGYDSFDIRDNKFVTNFRYGVVHLVFYAEDYDNIGNQLIPDNYRIREYIEAFIKYKMFETLTNQTNDETFQQLQQKLVYYKQLSEEAFIMAMIEIRKQTVYDKQRRIKQDLNRFNMYELPNRVSRYGQRRNS